MKKTVVEWLANRIIELEERFRLKEININDFIEEKDLLIDQALVMEKEQLIMFGAQCMVESEKESGLGAIKIYELFFDKTFKSE